MFKQKIFILCALFALAAFLFWFKIPVASSQGLTLIAARVTEPLPSQDLDSPVWLQATPLEIPLSAQNVARPMLLETNVKAVTARALYNDQQIAVLVEWADATDNSEMVRVQDFRDAVALQFPLGADQPFVCMGVQGANVNIWHWKADWQRDLVAWQDMNTLYPNMNVDYYPFANGENPAPSNYTDANYVPAFATDNLMAMPHKSSVEDLVAGGYGTLTSQPLDAQNIHGYGAWNNNQWRVIFTRNLASAESDDVSFAEGKLYSLAFAAWDSANNERNGQKSTSEWLSLQIGKTAPVTQAPSVSRVTATPPSPEAVAIPLALLVVPLVLLLLMSTFIWKEDEKTE